MAEIIFRIILIAIVTEIPLEILFDKFSWKKRVIILLLLIIALFISGYFAYGGS